MRLLMLLDGLGKEEGAPVRQGANDAAILEEECAGFEGDSIRIISRTLRLSIKYWINSKSHLMLGRRMSLTL